MQLNFVLSANERDKGDLPYLPVVNMFAEQTASEEVVLQSRPGLAATSYTSDGVEVKAIYKKNNVLNGQLFRVTANSSGANLYRDNTLIGAISTSIPNYGSIAGWEGRIFATANDDLHTWNGTTLSTLAVPSTGSINKILVAGNRLIVLGRTTQTFYWSDPLSTTIDALSFATAESAPDRIFDMLFVGDILILFGAETVEFWPITTDADLPFQRLQGRTFSIGVKQLGGATEVGAGFAWITNRDTICVNTPENIISFPGLEHKINQSTNNELWRFFFQGIEFLVLSTDTQTWVYDFRSSTWSLFTDTAGARWPVRCWDGGYFGAYSGAVYELSSTNITDLGTAYEKSFSAYSNLVSGGEVVHNLSVRANPGTGSAQMDMRISQDHGRTWTDWRSISWANTAYRQPLVWRSWGMISQPGILVEMRVPDASDIRISGVFMNEPYGGV